MKNFTYIMDGMDCPHCASLIEGALKKLPDCESASVNFIAKELNISFGKDKSEEAILPELQKQVSYFEPEMRLLPKPQHKEPPAEEKKKADRDLLRIVIAGILFAVGFVLHIAGRLELLSTVFFLFSYLIAGAEVLLTACRNIAKGRIFDENLLMSIASLGAIAISSYAEAAAVMLFYMVGEYFQSLAVDRSRRSINALIDNRPDYATLWGNGTERRVPAAEVQIGSKLLIKAGEKIPLDGIIIEGHTSLDTKAISGEPLPCQAGPQTPVYAGCINLEGAIIIESSKPYDDSLLANICRLIESSATNKAPAESFITRFARVYTPIVVCAAAALCLIPTLLAPAQFSDWLYRALVFLVVSCPCALVISVPLSFFAGIGGASRHGILIKGGNYLSAITEAQSIAFDKTGTLTKGNLLVEQIIPKPGFEAGRLLELAAIAESRSNHPIALSVQKAYGALPPTEELQDLQEQAGMGIEAIIAGDKLLVGNIKLLQKHQIALDKPNKEATLFLAINGNYAGCIIIADEIKPESRSALADLKAEGLSTVMLTGDNAANAAKYAAELGIDKYYAELLPTDKVSHIQRIKDEKASKLLFVGDGINDAPALALADVGIAMGGIGSDAAIEAADAVIMNDDMARLPLLRKIAVKTTAIVKQNIAFALIIKLAILLLAALGAVGMWAAVFADVGVALLTILNATRAGHISE